jgi:energy-coupling factor transporter ATP-binding protein EcfA2
MKTSSILKGIATEAHPLHELSARAGVVFQNPSPQLFHTTVGPAGKHELAVPGLASHQGPRPEPQPP